MSLEAEITALIQLLDDNDKEVYRHVHDKLISFGAPVIPALEMAWGSDLNPLTHERLEDIIHEIQMDALVADWKAWLELESRDLLTGAFLIAKYHYPDLNLEELHKKIQKLKQSIWLELNYNQTPLEQIQIFNQVFFSYQSFKGVQSSADYQDYCINNVIETRKGNSISIGIIYQILASDLDLPVYGVTLTKHYILAFCKKRIMDFSVEENLEREVMFYINPINKGSIFSRNEIKDYLEKLREEPEVKNFIPATNERILIELLGSMIENYTAQNRSERVDDLNYLLELLKSS